MPCFSRIYLLNQYLFKIFVREWCAQASLLSTRYTSKNILYLQRGADYTQKMNFLLQTDEALMTKGRCSRLTAKRDPTILQ